MLRPDHLLKVPDVESSRTLPPLPLGRISIVDVDEASVMVTLALPLMFGCINGGQVLRSLEFLIYTGIPDFKSDFKECISVLILHAVRCFNVYGCYVSCFSQVPYVL